MSPEYAVNGKFSAKSDVFSFGVLLLEIISAQKIRSFCHPDHHHSLLGHVSIKNDFVAFVPFHCRFSNDYYSRHGCCGMKGGPWSW